jgi:hypothetical protein
MLISSSVMIAASYCESDNPGRSGKVKPDANIRTDSLQQKHTATKTSRYAIFCPLK